MAGQKEPTSRPGATVALYATMTGLIGSAATALGSVAGYLKGGMDDASSGALAGSLIGFAIGVFVAWARIRAGVLDAPRRVPRVGEFVDGWQVLRVTARGGYRFEVRDGRGRHGWLRYVDLESAPDAGSAVNRLQQESRILGSAASPYLASVLAEGRIRNLYYLVTEYFSGPSLLSRVTPAAGAPRPLSGHELFQAARGSLEAVAEIHEHNGVHGAVNPAAVILRDNGVGSLAELGHRTPFERRRDTSTAMNGYVAPEGGGTPPADVYGWAASMVFAATGHTPRPAPANQSAALETAACPGWLRTILAEALDREPAKRPDARSLAADLDRAAGRMGMTLGIPGPQRAAPPGLSRPRWLSATVACGLLGLLLAVFALPGRSHASLGTGQPAPGPSTPATAPSPSSPSSPPTEVSSDPVPTTPSAASSTTSPTALPATLSASPPPTTSAAPVSTSSESGFTDAWPTSSRDGTPAMYAYFGSEFYLPDWTSCDGTHCITSDGGATVYLYNQHPIGRIKEFSSQTASPYHQLLANGLSSSEAKALLKSG